MMRNLFLLGLCVLSTAALMSCDQFKKGNSETAQKIFDKQSGDATPDSILGYWEARSAADNSDSRSVVWRLKIEENKMTLAERCFDGPNSLQSVASLKIEMTDQGSRIQIDFKDGSDFRVGSKDFACGGYISKNSSSYAYLKSYRLEMQDMFPNLTFEKILDLEAKK